MEKFFLGTLDKKGESTADPLSRIKRGLLNRPLSPTAAEPTTDNNVIDMQLVWEDLKKYEATEDRTLEDRALFILLRTFIQNGRLKNSHILYLDQNHKWIMNGRNIGDFSYIQHAVSLIRETSKFDVFLPPQSFKESSFEDFEPMCEGHIKALALLQNLGEDPKRGAFFWGNYGTGKTHLMSAYALSAKELIEIGYLKNIADFSKRFIENNAWDIETAFSYPYGDLTERRAKQQQSNQTLNDKIQQGFQEDVKSSIYTPDSLAFTTFDELFNRRNENGFLASLLTRRILIIDDVHHEGDKARMDLIRRIVEERYNTHRKGGTFFTSNLNPNSLLTADNYPPEIIGRVNSRLTEICFNIQFTSKDYRTIIAGRENEELEKLVNATNNETP